MNVRHPWELTWSFLVLWDEATCARYWMTFLVFSVFPAPDSPLNTNTRREKHVTWHSHVQMSNHTLCDHVTHVHRMDWSSRSVRKNRNAEIIYTKTAFTTTFISSESDVLWKDNLNIQWEIICELYHIHQDFIMNKVRDIYTAVDEVFGQYSNRFQTGSQYLASCDLRRRRLSGQKKDFIYSVCSVSDSNSNAWLHKQHFVFQKMSLHTNPSTTHIKTCVRLEKYTNAQQTHTHEIIINTHRDTHRDESFSAGVSGFIKSRRHTTTQQMMDDNVQI